MDDYEGPDRRKKAVTEPLTCGHTADSCPHTLAAAAQAVKQVFAILGVDIDEPDQVENFREDLRFGRKLRRVADKGAMAFFSSIAVALGAALWAAITNKLGGH